MLYPELLKFDYKKSRKEALGMSAEIKSDMILKLIKAICTRVKEKEGYLNKTKLIKYLYLIDVEYFRYHKKTFTGFNWIFYDFGPWSYEYNDIIREMSKSPEFTITQSSRSEYDTNFISCAESEEFESIFDDIDDELRAKGIVDKWADEPLNLLLNYVYFRTEPMEDAERYKPLDFTKIHTLESILKFKLTKGITNLKERAAVQNTIKKRLLSARKTPVRDTTFTPPRYDDDYHKNMHRMDIDDEY